MLYTKNISAQVSYSTPNLNTNWMTAVIGRSRHVTDWTILRLVGGRIQDRTSCPFDTHINLWEWPDPTKNAKIKIIRTFSYFH